MCSENEEDAHFLITYKEMLRRLRRLSDEDRKEVERKFVEIALKYAKWGE